MTAYRWFGLWIVIAACCMPHVAGAENADDPFGPAAGSEENDASPEASAHESNDSSAPIEATGPAMCRCVGEGDAAAIGRIEKALNGSLKSGGIDVSETPLEEVIMRLQEEYGIPMQIDANALEAIGISPAEPVTVNLQNISLRAALRLMLNTIGLTSMIRDEVLMITTPEAAEAQLVTCVYDVRDLVSIAREGGAAADFDSLVDAIVSCTRTATWKENGGGEAEIRTLQPGLLVISQTSEIHSEIRALLNTIREMQSAPAAESPQAADDGTTVTRSYTLQVWQPERADKELTLKQVRNLILQSLPDVVWEGRLDNGQPVVLSVMPDRVVLRHTPAIQAQVRQLLLDSGLTLPTDGQPNRGGFTGGWMGGGGGGFFAAPPAAE